MKQKTKYSQIMVVMNSTLITIHNANEMCSAISFNYS